MTYAYKKMSSLPVSSSAIRAYPQAIAHAADRATDDRIPEICTLSAKARLLLQKIVRSIPKDNPRKSVRISNVTFSIAIRVSDRTVARLKTELEDAGFITRHQVQSRRLGMQVADIWLTDMALQLLGLADTQRAPKTVDAYCLSQSLSERQPADAVPTKKEQPGSQSVPPDLHLLQDCGLTVPAIRKLMGMASETGHLLGTIVQAAGKHIVKAGKPYCYVRKLILSGKDWGAKADVAQQEAVEQAQQVAEATQRNDDVELLQREASKTGLLTSAKRACVWAWVDGWLKKGPISAALSNSAIVDWSPLADIAPIAQALREGKVFPVERDTLRQWVGGV